MFDLNEFFSKTYFTSCAPLACKLSPVSCYHVFLLEVLASMFFTIVVLRYCIDNSHLYPSELADEQL